MPRVLSVSLVAFAALCGLFASVLLGPLHAMPEIVRVDERFLDAMRNQQLLAALLCSLAGAAAAEVLREPVRVTAAVLLACGPLSPLASQLGEPDFPAQLGGAIADFMVPYCAVCMGVLAAVIAGRYFMRRWSDGGGG